MYRTMYAELRQRISGDDFASALDTRGRFVKVMVKGRKYWYFDRPGPGGRQKRKYVGPDSDETIRSCVERFAELKANARQRRNLITTLKRQARLAGPDPSTGDIIEAIAAAGFFHRRGVLIGAAAYRCYPAYLGIELPFLLMETANVDFVQFHSISTDVQNQTAALGNVLRELDPTFRDITNEIDGSPNKVFGNKRGKKVESPLQSASSADDLEKTVTRPLRTTTTAEQATFVDFLTCRPVQVALLHGSGVPITVPAPERFAIQELISASGRSLKIGDVAEREKNVAKALTLMEALIYTRRTSDLAEAYDAARNRGEAWGVGIAKGIDVIRDRERLSKVIENLNKALAKVGSEPVLVN